MEEYYIFIAILIFVALYVYSYYKYPDKIHILQIHPDEFKTNMLLEKQPIVIDNNASSLSDLKSACFMWSPTQSFNISGSNLWHYNKYKHIAIQLESAGEILLCPPTTKMLPNKSGDITTQEPDPEDANLLAIQAKTNEIIIIPFHWRYLIDTKLDVKCMGIHDWVTYVLP
jgi:hypothetical protein